MDSFYIWHRGWYRWDDVWEVIWWKLEIQDGRQGLIFDEKMTILPVDHHVGHKIGPIVFILGMNITKFKNMPYEKRLPVAVIGNSKWPPRGFFGSFLTLKMTRLPLDHHSVYRISPVVFILSEHVAKFDNMPYVWSLTKVGNSKWPPGGCLSMKTMPICIGSGLYKHGWILLKFGM